MILSSSHMLTHVEAADGKFHYSVFTENRVSYLGSGRSCFSGIRQPPPPTPIRVRCQYDSIFERKYLLNVKNNPNYRT